MKKLNLFNSKMTKKIIILLLVCAFAAVPLSNSLAQGNDVIDVLDLKNMDVSDVLKLISQKSGLNIVAGQNVNGKVTVYLKNIKVLEALRIISDAYGWAYMEQDGVIQVMTDKEFEIKYGFKFGQELRTRVKQLLYANASDVLAVLNQIKSAAGKIISDEKSNTLIIMDTARKIDEMEMILKTIDVPIKTEIFQLNYSTAEDLSTKVSEALTVAVGKMKFDARSNTIIVTDTERKLQEVREIIEAFDQKDKEVSIEAKIIQVVLSDDQKMGIDWEALINEYHGLDLITDFDILGETDKRGKLTIGTLDDDRYTLLIEALNTVGMTDILSSPRITAINNKEAKILVGSTEPYVTTTTTTPSSGPTTTAEAVNFIEVGVKLFVTPTIHNDGFITMKIKPEVSSVTRNVTTSNNNTIPVVETSEAETTVNVKDGVTIMIGGLIKEEQIKEKKHIPLLGSIPYLGTAFSSKSDFVRKTELVIFLRPQIITGDVNEEAVTTY